MKNLKLSILGLLAVFFMLTSCTSVESGHQGVKVSFGGKIDMSKTLDEGFYWGFNYLWDDVIEYEVREQTISVSSEINDKNDMRTPIEVTIYFAPVKEQVNIIHKEFGPSYAETKLSPILRASIAKIVPQYTATELNKNKRAEAERLLNETMLSESKGMFLDIKRVQLGKVGIPTEVARLAEETAAQEGRNALASKKEEEQVQLAKALVAKSQGEYEAALFDAKTKDILSQPKMLDLLRLENEKIMWEGYSKTGKSPFGENNYFGSSNGSNPLMLLKNR